MDYYELASRSSCNDSLKLLEADIQHANALAASIPRAKGGACVQMKLVYNHLAPIVLLLLQWMNCSCTCLLSSYLNLFHIVVYKVRSDGKPKISSYGRKATIREFYAVILPSLQLLHGDTVNINLSHEVVLGSGSVVNKRPDEKRKLPNMEIDWEDECGICLEPCTKMVVPSCCHAMCINCYRDWNTRSESCPFCRGSLKRVDSGDLWVLPSGSDIIDPKTAVMEDVLRFYLYINSLPKDIPNALFWMYYEYLI